MGMAIYEFKISTKYLLTLVILHIVCIVHIEMDKLSVHERVHFI